MDADLQFLAEVTGARVRSGARVQSLWSGYGEIVRVHLERDPDAHAASTAILKCVRPPRSVPPEETFAHRRKCRSYDVEVAFYRTYAPRCDASCRVPARLAHRASPEGWLLALEDLDAAGFGGRRHRLDARELELCLAWLASFHATFLGVRPEGLWETGTYWHLATRPDELAAMRPEDDDLREAAPLLDRLLRDATHQTLVHGDAKPANFCFDPRGPTGEGAVAAVDFQYVGGGSGMKDVAYLLHGEPEPERALDVYFTHLRRALAARPDLRVDAADVEREGRALYPIAYADFARFMAGWAPSHWKRDTTAQRLTRATLRRLA